MATDIKIYGTPEDLAVRWRTLNTEEESRANVLISDANYLLRQIALNNNVDLDAKIAADATGYLEKTVTMVILNAVQREIGTPTDAAPDATNWSQAATPYSEQITFSGGNNNSLYFKQRELALLGLSSVSGKPQISILRGARGVSDELGNN